MTPLAIHGFDRDPRSEPKVGDELQRGSMIRTVSAVRHSPFAGKPFVSYKTTAAGRRIVSIDAWRCWAREAAVTRRAS